MIHVTIGQLMRMSRDQKKKAFYTLNAFAGSISQNKPCLFDESANDWTNVRTNKEYQLGERTHWKTVQKIKTEWIRSVAHILGEEYYHVDLCRNCWRRRETHISQSHFYLILLFLLAHWHIMCEWRVVCEADDERARNWMIEVLLRIHSMWTEWYVVKTCYTNTRLSECMRAARCLRRRKCQAINHLELSRSFGGTALLRWKKNEVNVILRHKCDVSVSYQSFVSMDLLLNHGEDILEVVPKSFIP